MAFASVSLTQKENVMNRNQCSTSSSLAILGGAVLGAAALYFLDPESGRKRRSKVSHAFEDAWHTTRDKAVNAGQSVASAASNWANTTCDTGYDFADNMTDQASDAVDIGRSAVTGGISSLAGKMSGLGHNVWDRIRHTRDDAADQASGWFDGITSKARDMSHPARHRLAKAIDPDHVRGASHAVGWSAAGVGAVAAGVASMYFFDPQLGLERRNRCMNAISSGLEQVSSSSRKLGKAVADQYARIFGGGDQGQGYQGQRYQSSTRMVDGEELLRRVRSRVGQVLANPTDVQLMADADGTVTLDGRVPENERDFLLSAIRHVPGVCRIYNRLETATSSSQWSASNAGTSGTSTTGSETAPAGSTLSPQASL